MAGSKMPKLDFSRLESAEQPEFGSQYSKDYWDIVFEQLGKRALFKVGVVVLTLLYGVAAFAPLIANDRPYYVDSVDIGGFKKATRVRPMAWSVMVHHLGHSSKGLRGSMNMGQQLKGRMSSSQKSRSVRAVRTWRRV